VSAGIEFLRSIILTITADATATLVLRQVPAGATLVSDSGVVYPVVPAS
jgi:hypothetical protein